MYDPALAKRLALNLTSEGSAHQRDDIYDKAALSAIILYRRKRFFAGFRAFSES